MMTKNKIRLLILILAVNLLIVGFGFNHVSITDPFIYLWYTIGFTSGINWALAIMTPDVEL